MCDQKKAKYSLHIEVSPVIIYYSLHIDVWPAITYITAYTLVCDQ